MRGPIVALRHWRGERGQHAGLILQRYLCEDATGDHGNHEEKRAVLHAAIRAANDDEVRALYRRAFERWSASLPAITKRVELKTAGRLIVGLGSEGVLETDIRLHHTYGLSVIPGSALKGLAAHYCDRVDGRQDAKFRRDGEHHRILFGTSGESGCVTFHDAWLTPDSLAPLALDVMTPHHPGWNDEKNPAAPTDFDSPTPVPFLSVTGTFRVAVSWHGPAYDEAAEWTRLARSLLRDALKEWGVGGKTSSGYGRLVDPPPPVPPPPPSKRDSGAKANVRIVVARPKGGFDVQDTEPGRNPGTLTMGTPPTGVDVNPGSIVDVLVHNDDPRRPQYKWPSKSKK